MSLHPLGHRILVKPDPQPEQTDSGLVLPQDHDHIAYTGTVVELGPGGSTIRHKARQRALDACLAKIEILDKAYGPIFVFGILRKELEALKGTPDTERDVAVGDRVAFPAEAGMDVTVDGEAYVIVSEDDVVAIDREEAVA